MKLPVLLLVLGGIFVCSGLQEPVWGQSPPAWYIVFEEKMEQGDRVQFLRTQKAAFDLWKEQYPDEQVYVWQNDNSTLYKIMPIRSFASLDTLYGRLDQVSQAADGGSHFTDDSPGHRSTVSGTVMIWVPELSHSREREFTHYPGKPYTEWMFVYLLSGQEEEAEEALKNFRDYYSDKNLDYPWDTFRVLFGKDTPLMVGMFRAESPSSLKEKGNKIWEKHGGELEMLWNQVVRHTWKIENKTGWFNQSLSNVPVVQPDVEIVNSKQ